jgi:hypothetical protein
MSRGVVTSLLVALAIMSLALTQSYALAFTSGQHDVVIRIDDIQDYQSIPEFTGPEYRVLQYHIDRHIPALVALIMTRFGTDPHLLQLIRTGFDSGIFLLGNHGWHHDLFNNKSASVQTQELGYAENRLQSIFGIHVLTFVPPYGGYDSSTIAAMKANQMTLISATSDYDQSMLLEQDGILYFPQTVTTAEVDPGTDSWIPRSIESITGQISASWEAWGVAVVVIHPKQFVDVNDTWVDARWNIYTQMVDWVKANQGTFTLPTPPKPPVKQANVDTFLISVGLFSGITSTLIIAFNISSKRSKQKKASFAGTGLNASTISTAGVRQRLEETASMVRRRGQS